MVLLHLSDLHFGTEQPAVAEALCRLTHRLEPDIALLTGDITQRARCNQFRAAVGFRQRLRVATMLAVPGNHDIPLFNLWSRLVAPYRNYCTGFGNDREPQFNADAVFVACVDTTRWYRHKNGELARAQIERVAGRLRSCDRDQLRIVAMHHPVLAIRMKDENNLVRRGNEAVFAWAEAGADLVLGGHIHLPYVRPLHQAIPGLPRKVWTVQAGTGVSWRTRDGIPNSVNIIRTAPSPQRCQCSVERWDYSVKKGEFEKVEINVLYLDRKAPLS